MVSLIAVAMTVVVNLLPTPPLHFRYPSSDKIIALAADRADKLNIEITKLGSNIYGLEIGQINRDGQSYKYASAIHAHTFTSDNPDDLSRTRQSEIEGQYASHWRQQAGWRDHCRDLKISRAHFYWMQQNLLNQQRHGVSPMLKYIYASVTPTHRPKSKKGLNDSAVARGIALSSPCKIILMTRLRYFYIWSYLSLPI